MGKLKNKREKDKSEEKGGGQMEKVMGQTHHLIFLNGQTKKIAKRGKASLSSQQNSLELKMGGKKLGENTLKKKNEEKSPLCHKLL